jgi:hypothetical protein
MEMEKSGPVSLIEKNRLQYFYDRFLMNRIGVRTLIYQHSKWRFAFQFFLCIDIYLALLFGNELPQHPQQAGIISPYVDVASIVKGKIFRE